jgi:hypothetical protein
VREAANSGSFVMTIKKGSRLSVNLAPFIGSQSPSKQSVLCRALDVREGAVLVRTEEPYRSVSLWIESGWIERIEPEEARPPARRARRPVLS